MAELVQFDQESPEGKLLSRIIARLCQEIGRAETREFLRLVQKADALVLEGFVMDTLDFKEAINQWRTQKDYPDWDKIFPQCGQSDSATDAK
jgi:hypothetical protein